MSDPQVEDNPHSNEEDEVVPEDTEAQHYPKLDQGPACAKDYDPCFLNNCTSNRLRKIATNYKDVNSKLPKTLMFRALFNAMSADQD